MQNWFSKKSRKSHGKKPVQQPLFNKAANLSDSSKTLQHRCFSVNVGIFLRTPFLQNTSGRLLK